jgi:hypothetical protein
MDIPRHVRFTPGSDRIADIPERQLRADFVAIAELISRIVPNNHAKL